MGPLGGTYLGPSYPKRFNHTTNTRFGGLRKPYFFPTKEWWNKYLHLLFFSTFCKKKKSKSQTPTQIWLLRSCWKPPGFHMWKIETLFTAWFFEKTIYIASLKINAIMPRFDQKYIKILNIFCKWDRGVNFLFFFNKARVLAIARPALLGWYENNLDGFTKKSKIFRK